MGSGGATVENMRASLASSWCVEGSTEKGEGGEGLLMASVSSFAAMMILSVAVMAGKFKLVGKNSTVPAILSACVVVTKQRWHR